MSFREHIATLDTLQPLRPTPLGTRFCCWCGAPVVGRGEVFYLKAGKWACKGCGPVQRRLELVDKVLEVRA